MCGGTESLVNTGLEGAHSGCAESEKKCAEVIQAQFLNFPHNNQISNWNFHWMKLIWELVKCLSLYINEYLKIIKQNQSACDKFYLLLDNGKHSQRFFSY